MDLQVNDIVMIVNVKNKKVVYIESVSCAYRGTFSTSIFNISKNLEIIYCNRPNDKEEYKIAKVWRFNKEKDDLVIIYPVDYVRIYSEQEIEKLKEQRLFVINNKEHELAVHDIVPDKVLQENAELKEIIVDQAKEIHNLKKEGKVNHD